MFCFSPKSFRSNKLFLLTVIGLTISSTVFARPHKLRVSDPAEVAKLEASGARVLADYGSFQILEIAGPLPVSTKSARVESADDSDYIEMNAAALDTRAPATVGMRKAVGSFGGKHLHLIQFIGPVKPEWRAALEQTGVKVVQYIPQNAYLIQGSQAELAQAQSWASASDFVQWEGQYADDYKIHPSARTVDTNGISISPATDLFAVQLLEDAEANPATLALIKQLELEPVKQQFQTLHYVNVIVRLPPGKLAELAARPEVISIQPYFERHKMDERQDQIMAGNLTGSVPSGTGYLAWLASKGFTQAQFNASGFVVDVSDSGIDNGTTNAGHFGLYQAGDPAHGTRVIYNRLEGTPNSGSTLQGCDGHGNLNSHIIAGFNDRANGFPHTDSSGFHYGLGVCPFVKVGSSVIFDSDTFTSPNYANLTSRAYRDGARVSNNSWGANTAGAYDVDAQTYDALVRDAQPSGSSVPNAGNQQMTIVFAAGNAGPGTSTVGSPGTAKNVIVVGAAENVHSHSTANGGNNTAGNDGCTTPDTEANSADDIASFSSRGPCSDGRQKPDLVAPGTHITGGVGQAVLTTNGNGTAISCFKATGVCGLPGGGTIGSASNFFPVGQQFYSTSSGTSHSTPGVVGACALLRQYFINNSLPPPSPAMTKAFLVNSARYMTGVSANDKLPSPNQGMGAVNLGTAFDGVTRILHDQLSTDKFTNSGATHIITGSIVDSSKPFRVTLGWTDAPGSTTGNAYNNNLDLTVTIGGNIYYGNVFSGGVSVTGGTSDGKNNVESVFIPAGVTGSFTVTVTAVNIPSDGVPNEGPATDQDYALVIYNGTETESPIVLIDSLNLTAENCASTNGFVDPGETVTFDFAFRNVGLVDTTNLVATLLATNGVTLPSGAQTYGALVAGGGAVTQAFSFTASGVCGSNITATFALTDGAASLGTISSVIPLGQFAPIFGQNFDGVTAPALPAGWTSSTGVGQSLWTTVTSSSDTAPNAAFSPDPATTGSNELVSIAITLMPGLSQLTFRHRYILEPGYDGGVLEMKIGAGAFMDILTNGGSFVSGGYVQTLSSGNALGARQAWTGTNSSFSTVVVNLPASSAGQSVQFRWRCGTDSSVSRSGWWVDSVFVNSSLCCGAVFPPFITGQPASQTVSPGSPVNFSVLATGQAPLSYQWYFNSNFIAGATNSLVSIASAQITDMGNYFVIVTNDAGSATSSVAILTVSTAPLVLAGWDVSGQSSYGVSPMSPTTNASNLTIVGLTRGSGVTTGGTATTRAWGGNGFDAASASAAVTAGDFATFSIKANAGYKVSFASISKFDYRRSTSGPLNGVLQYQVGSSAFVNVITNSYSSTSGASLSAIDLSAFTGLQNVGPGTNVTFRIVNYGATSSGGNWYIYDVANTSALDLAVQGTVMLLSGPPATAPLLSSANVVSNQLQFTLTGTAGSNYVVEISTNLMNGWSPVYTGAAPILFAEPATNEQRFYRGKILP